MQSDSGCEATSLDQSPSDKAQTFRNCVAYNRRQIGTLSSNTFTNSGNDQPFELFICSEAGKPVYFYNKSLPEEYVVTLVGVVQAMVNFYEDANADELKCINTLAGLRVTFCIKSPLIIVLVTEKLSPFDSSLIINQVFASVVSILSFKMLKKVFDDRQSLDLRNLLAGSEKVIDTLIEEGFLKGPLCISNKVVAAKSAPLSLPSSVYGYLTSMPTNISSTPSLVASSVTNPLGRTVGRTTNRVLIPVMPLIPSHRDALSNALASSITMTTSSVAFAILIHLKTHRSVTPSKSTRDAHGSSGLLHIQPNTQLDLDSCELMTIFSVSPKKAKLNPLDIQLILSLVISSEGQLASADSLWLPICIPRVDTDNFFFAHMSHVPIDKDQATSLSASTSSDNESSSSEDKICSVLLATSREDFAECQQIMLNFREKICKLKLSRATFSDLNAPFLHSMIYYSTNKPTAMVYRNLPFVAYTNFKKLLNYLCHRMTSQPNYKILWLHSDEERVTLLGWSSSTFTIYFQFNATVNHGEALAAASNALKWIKKEEEKFKLKDYQ